MPHRSSWIAIRPAPVPRRAPVLRGVCFSGEAAIVMVAPHSNRFRTMTTRTIAFSPAIVAAFCAACSRPAGPPEVPPSVEVATPLSERVTDWDDYSGRFEAVDAVEVRPRVSGAIESVHFADGQVVRQGELLFVIDPRPYAAELARAKAQVAGARAQLANADAELKRAQALVGARLVSEAETEVRVAAQLSAAAA